MAVAVKEEVLADFTGGQTSRTASMEFADNQWAKLKGFVLEERGRLRSQWALQKIGGVSGIEHFGTYFGHSGTLYLVAVKSDGTIEYAAAPGTDVLSTDAAIDPTWTAVGVTSPSSDRRALTTIKLRDESSAGLRSGLLLGSIHEGDSSEAVILYENDAGDDLVLKEESDRWPVDDTEDAMPKGQYAEVWNGVLVLGDIEWKDDSDGALEADNKKRHRNGLFLSKSGDPFRWDPLNVLLIGEPHERIAGLHQTDAGLLVFTDGGVRYGGVYLLRGTPDSYSLETVRTGVGASSKQANWAHTGSAVWVNAKGEVHQTDGKQVIRLDSSLGIGGRLADEDGCAAFGPYLLVQRDQRVFVLAAVDQEGATWTELAVPDIGTLDMTSGTGASPEAFYFVVGGELFRWNAVDLDDDSERGGGTEGLPDLTVGTRTLEQGSGHEKANWRALGIRATAGHDSPQAATIEKVVLYAGPALDDHTPSLERGWETDLVEADERLRFQAKHRGIGPSNEFSADVVFTGDVVVEQLAVFYTDSTNAGDREGQ